MANFVITAKVEEINESSYTIASTGELVTKIQLSLVVPTMRGPSRLEQLLTSESGGTRWASWPSQRCWGMKSEPTR